MNQSNQIKSLQHDTTLAAFMSALGVYNGEQSPYASAVGVELWEEDKG